MLNDMYRGVKYFVKQFMKSKMGRPKLPKGESKDTLIGARFSPDESRTVIAAVKRSGQGKSAWIRKALLSAAESDKSAS
jgi:hypothetical protein